MPIPALGTFSQEDQKFGGRSGLHSKTWDASNLPASVLARQRCPGETRNTFIPLHQLCRQKGQTRYRGKAHRRLNQGKPNTESAPP